MRTLKKRFSRPRGLPDDFNVRAAAHRHRSTLPPFIALPSPYQRATSFASCSGKVEDRADENNPLEFIP
ncbi:MAG: hypothetical protein ACFNUE_08155, partial [Bacteroides sp.]